MRILRFGLANYRPFCATQPLNDLTAEDLPLHWLSLDQDAVIIVGENNTGKTGLLSAYRDFRSTGFQPSREDFFAKSCDAPIVMEAVLHADGKDEIEEDKTEKWFDSNTLTARVRKVWNGPEVKADKFTYDPIAKLWVEKGFGGWDTILQSRLPEPLHIKPYMTPEEVTATLQKLMKEIVQRYIEGSEEHAIIADAFKKIEEKIENDGFVKDVADRMSTAAADVFPSLRVAITNPVSDKGILPLFEKRTDVELLIADSPQLNVERHGHGSQRVFVLGALGVLADELAKLAKKPKAGDPQKIVRHTMLQIEEPELYLSPTAVRRMRDLLYKVAAQNSMQVMSCTHSPVMVDFSRPQQTIALVERTAGKSTIRQATASHAPQPLREQLRLIYQINPAVSEALFANKVILVEGPTEVAAVNRVLEIAQVNSDALDVHVIDCGGKTAIPALQSVLRQFGKRYLAVHDLDVLYADRANDEIEWNRNVAVWTEVAAARATGVDAQGFAFKLDFESAHGYPKNKKNAQADAWQLVTEIMNDPARRDDHSIPIVRLLETIRTWNSPFTSVQDIESVN